MAYTQSPLNKFFYCLELAAFSDSINFDSNFIVIPVSNDSLDFSFKSEQKKINHKFLLLFKEVIFFKGLSDVYRIDSFNELGDSIILTLIRENLGSGEYSIGEVIGINLIANLKEHTVSVVLKRKEDE